MIIKLGFSNALKEIEAAGISRWLLVLDFDEPTSDQRVQAFNEIRRAGDQQVYHQDRCGLPIMEPFQSSRTRAMRSISPHGSRGPSTEAAPASSKPLESSNASSVSPYAARRQSGTSPPSSPWQQASSWSNPSTPPRYGSTITVASPNENWHASADYTGNFEALIETIRKTTGTVVPMWSILSKDLPRDLLKNADAGAYLGKTLVAGKEAHHLAFSEKEEDWQIWVSTSETSPVPLMLIGTEKAKTGWPQYRVYMTDWNVDWIRTPCNSSTSPVKTLWKLRCLC
jgi:hypothetical protein